MLLSVAAAVGLAQLLLSTGSTRLPPLRRFAIAIWLCWRSAASFQLHTGGVFASSVHVGAPISSSIVYEPQRSRPVISG